MYLRLAVFILLVAASFWAAEYNRNLRKQSTRNLR